VAGLSEGDGSSESVSPAVDAGIGLTILGVTGVGPGQVRSVVRDDRAFKKLDVLAVIRELLEDPTQAIDVGHVGELLVNVLGAAHDFGGQQGGLDVTDAAQTPAGGTSPSNSSARPTQVPAAWLGPIRIAGKSNCRASPQTTLVADAPKDGAGLRHPSIRFERRWPTGRSSPPRSHSRMGRPAE